MNEKLTPWAQQQQNLGLKQSCGNCEKCSCEPLHKQAIDFFYHMPYSGSHTALEKRAEFLDRLANKQE